MKYYCLLFATLVSYTVLAQNWEWGGPLHPSQAAYDVKHITLQLEMAPDEKILTGTAILEIELISPLDHIRLDLIEQYTVSEVRVDSKTAKFIRDGDLVEVILPTQRNAGVRLRVEVDYGGVTPIAVRPPWQGGFTYAKDENNMHWVGLSSQNEGGKIFMPSKDHPSDEPDEGVELFIKVPAEYMVAANGVLISEIETGDHNTFHWKTNYSTNLYGINFTMGDFVSKSKPYTTIEGNTVPMEMYLLKQNEHRLEELMDILELSLQTQEKYFGEYPFKDEKIGIVETPYLGMEHQTINAYGNNYRYTTVGDVTYDTLLYHELGHEWWGNKLGVSDWADFWIHEGFCAYADWLFIEEHGGKDKYMQHVQQVAAKINNNLPIIVKENATSDEAYHSEIYTKGAYILHSLRYILEDEAFFKLLKAIITNPEFTYGNNVKTRDIQEFINNETAYDIAPFFDLYLRTTNIPEVVVKDLTGNRYSIEIPNIDFSLPMDVQLGNDEVRTDLSSTPVIVESTSLPIIDARGWYLKKVLYQ